MRIKKIVSSVLVAALAMAVSMPSPAFAAEKKSGTKIKLDDIYVTTNYDPSSIKVTRNETSKAVQVTVEDKTTGKVLDVWGEEKARIPDGTIKTDTIKPDITGTFDKKIYHDKVVGPVRARLNVYLEMYEYDSFVQIDKVKSMKWQAASSGNWYLEDESTDWHMDKQPGMTVDLYGSATVTVRTTASTQGSFSISALKRLGFSVGESVGSEYYARKPIDNDFGFSVD